MRKIERQRREKLTGKQNRENAKEKRKSKQRTRRKPAATTTYIYIYIYKGGGSESLESTRSRSHTRTEGVRRSLLGRLMKPNPFRMNTRDWPGHDGFVRWFALKR